MPEILTDHEKDIMLHALGLTPRGGRYPKKGHRNYFVAGAENCDDWQALVQRGLAVVKPYTGAPDSLCFFVTIAGMELLGEDLFTRVPADIKQDLRTLEARLKAREAAAA